MNSERPSGAASPASPRGAYAHSRGEDGNLNPLLAGVSIMNPYLSAGTKDMRPSARARAAARYDEDANLVPWLAAESHAGERGVARTSSIPGRSRGRDWSDGTP
jgi:hypothetical protein